MASQVSTRRRVRLVLAAAVVGAATAATTAMTPGAAVAADPSGGRAAATPSEGLLRAMARDAGVSRAEALAQLRFQDRATATVADARRLAGRQFAGAWVDPASRTVHVAATTEKARGAVRAGASGATLETVAAEHPLRTLTRWSARVGERLADRPRAAGTIVASYVDVMTNRLVVEAAPGRRDRAAALVKAAGVPASGVTVRTVAEVPRPLIDVVGGNPYYIANRAKCSVGFSVTGGFVTAGHCGQVGSWTTNPSGTFAGWSFPGNDYGYVRVNSGNTLIGAVNNYAGGRVAVTGSTPAALNAWVCRSGSTTGWHCGRLRAYDSTVYYNGSGTVYGLIRTTVCAEPGDSGGSLLAGTQAQGVTSGGSGNCTQGGTTYFQPVNEILTAYGVALIR